MKSFSGMGPPSVATAEQTLEQIKKKVGRIVWFNAIASGVSLTLLLVMLTEMAYFGPKLRPVLTPRRVAAALNDVLLTVHNLRNITDDVAFFSDNAHYLAARYQASQNLTAGARRALLQEESFPPEVAAALVGVLGAIQNKTAQLDVTAVTDLLRYVMAVDWRAQIAPRVDRGLASVQYAEVLAGAVVSAMSGVNASAARVQPPILA